jgi:hypothetical protein
MYYPDIPIAAISRALSFSVEQASRVYAASESLFTSFRLSSDITKRVLGSRYMQDIIFAVVANQSWWRPHLDHHGSLLLLIQSVLDRWRNSLAY